MEQWIVIDRLRGEPDRQRHLLIRPPLRCGRLHEKSEGPTSHAGWDDATATTWATAAPAMAGLVPIDG
ncbi:hypothetical protein ACFVTF_21305 [Kitasatospora sp. NPDC057940]|uniref:hypothetical protein n=1 Tax=Kitasatospora sp. NPDC057940 TaxID=3346285 RepID=UPI0036DC32F3